MRQQYRTTRSGSRSRSRRYSRKPSGIDINKLIKKAVETANEELPHLPSYTFRDLNISPELKANIERKGFENPTPIQEQSIPHILNGKDLVGIANTGTGKTGAFVIPILDKISKDRAEKVLIIAPTRELAEQINDEIYSLTKFMNIRSLLCVGGVNIIGQINKLRYSQDIVVGTPGRLIDLMKRGHLNVSLFKTIVLDEVDRMLDMGFVQDITFIISKLPQQRHSLFFSATITPEIENIMNTFVRDYIKISVKTGETSENINQDVIHIRNREEKVLKLEELLTSEDFKKVIVFVNTKHGVEKLDNHLFRKGFKVHSIHGNKRQSQRKRALEGFKNGRANILVATDVAARGLDVPNVTHVINYDMPATYDDYVHRIGRTGRASKTGQALTFVEQ